MIKIKTSSRKSASLPVLLNKVNRATDLFVPVPIVISSTKRFLSLL